MATLRLYGINSQSRCIKFGPADGWSSRSAFRRPAVLWNIFIRFNRSEPDANLGAAGSITTLGSNLDSSYSRSLGNVFQGDSKDTEIQDQADDDEASIPEAPAGEARVGDKNWFEGLDIDVHAERLVWGIQAVIWQQIRKITFGPSTATALANLIMLAQRSKEG